MNKREVKAIAQTEVNRAVARHERIDHPGTKETVVKHKGTGNEGHMGEATGMVHEHRHKEHHTVGQHELGSGTRHGEHKVPGAGAVPATPGADSATEPHPHADEGKDVD